MLPYIGPNQWNTTLKTSLTFEIRRNVEGTPKDYKGAERHMYLFDKVVQVAQKGTGIMVKVHHRYLVFLDPTNRKWRADRIENPNWGAAGRTTIYGPNREDYFDSIYDAAKAVEAFKKDREERA